MIKKSIELYCAKVSKVKKQQVKIFIQTTLYY